ncbi:hypothetical protein ACFQT4_00430 [Pseudoduganella danionis]|uniref:hypothetical protein n=1 Tax=Pseudoduganella danionis TaxID=1890295 RepID=UPI0036205314
MNRLLKLQTLLSSKWRFAVYPILALLFLSLSNFSNAQEVVPAFRVLDGIDAAFKPFQLTWQTAIKAHAQRLFWLLVGVDFAWTSVVYVLDKNTIEEIVISLVKKIFTIGFFSP